MSIESLKAQARRHEQLDEWQKALDQYGKAIAALAEADQPDIGLYNRVGDLFVRVGNYERALEHYERAVELYREAYLPNNAIAVCKKIIRHMPARHQVHLAMGQIRAEQGFVPDARTSFLAYAEIMQAEGNLDESFRALVEFSDLVPEEVDVRLAVADQMMAHGRSEDALRQFGIAYRVLKERGQDDRAFGLERRLIELDPDIDFDALLEDGSELPFAGDDGGFELGAGLDAVGEDSDDGSGPRDADVLVDEDALIDEDGLAEEALLAEGDVLVEEALSVEGDVLEDAPLAEEALADEGVLVDQDVFGDQPAFGADDAFGDALMLVDEDGPELPLVEGTADFGTDDEDDDPIELPLIGFDDEEEDEAEDTGRPHEVALDEVALDEPGEFGFEVELDDEAEPAQAHLLEADHEQDAEPTPQPAPAADYVDLGSMVFGDELDGPKDTRFRVAYQEPSGDETADFQKMLSQFKEKVSANLDASDVRAHHDLGTAYKEMGLLDEAIAEFQAALRASSDHLPTYELLGQTFLEMGKHEAAVNSLERALKARTTVEDELVGIYYYLARAYEHLGRDASAVDFYDRVFSLDINFLDVTERLRALR